MHEATATNPKRRGNAATRAKLDATADNISRIGDRG